MPQENSGEASNVDWFNMVDEESLDDNIDLESYELDMPEVPFEDSLEAIRGEALAPQDLLGFSNMTRKQVHELRAVWTTLPDKDRLVIAELALMLARENMFAEFGRFFMVLLGDTSSDVRLNAATGAALSEVDDLIRPLGELAADDENVDVREAAVLALAPHVVALDIGFEPDKKSLQHLMNLKIWAQDEEQPAAIRAAALHSYSHNTMDDDVDGIIQDFVASDDETMQLGAMRAMSVYGAGKFTSFLERQLDSSDIDVREAAAAAMAESDDPAVVPMLTMLARTDVEPSVREVAYVSLANIATDKALESLTELRKNASEDDVEIIDGAIQYITDMNELEAEIEEMERQGIEDEENY